ncbi:GlxA family transcriptional regulator [Brenneria uluponensis]|uniref:GlxA family transcriptional regulator n=1 Tax=Brenneria uluponensis TaxID=3057057 RepID=UPI0028ED142E|nr:GlxA family transcriptional regulator [Brenneria ulupoensis]
MKRIIAFFLFDGFQILDAAGPIAAFEMPTRFVQPAPYTLKLLSRDGGLITSSSGAAMQTEPMHQIRSIDTLILAGGIGIHDAAQCPATLAFVRRQAEIARRVCSVCSGAYLLATTGLLNGRQATTHWRRTKDFARRFPKVLFRPDQIYTQDDKFWTSAGITAGIDLALALIEDDLGAELSKQVAQQLVVYHRRGGGQSQFSALLEFDTPGSRFSELLPWIREHIAECLSVQRLAEHACMSERNFARTFRSETGITPAKAVEKIRLELARNLIESTQKPIEAIAIQTGFVDAERMRKAFLRIYGQPPQSVRRAVRAQAGNTST